MWQIIVIITIKIYDLAKSMFFILNVENFVLWSNLMLTITYFLIF